MNNSTDSEEGRTTLDANEGFNYYWTILVVVLCLILIFIVVIANKITSLLRSKRQHQPITSNIGEGMVQETRNTAAGVKPNDDHFNSPHRNFNTGFQVETAHIFSETNTGYQYCQYDEFDNYSNSGNGQDYSKNHHQYNRSGYDLNVDNVVNESIYDDVKNAVDDTHYDHLPSAIKPVQPIYDYPQPRPTPEESVYDQPAKNRVPLGSAAAAGQNIYDYPRLYQNLDYTYDYPSPYRTPAKNEVPDEAVYDRPPKYPASVVPRRDQW